MTDIVERLRTKHILGVFEIERLRQEAADEIERLRSKTSMADGMLALSGLNVDIHATDIAVMKSTMAKLIAAEKEIERLRNAAQRVTEPPFLESLRKTAKVMKKAHDAGGDRWVSIWQEDLQAVEEAIAALSSAHRKESSNG